MEEIEYRLEQDCELRFEVGKKNPVHLILESGRAEIYGTELTPKKEYVFAPYRSIFVYTWEGCLLRIKGNPENTYSAKETPMGMYLNTHACIERLRQMADEQDSRDDHLLGPVAMVVGSVDVGKSTICNILLNFAIRHGRKPLFVDIDVGQGKLSVPGSLCALAMNKPISVEDEFLFETSIVYNFGHKTPSANLKLYNGLVSKLADVVREKLLSDKKISSSGVIINTCGWVKEKGYDILMQTAKAFEVDVIIVVDHEKLYNNLVKDIPFVKVMFLPKSGGVISRSSKMRLRERENRIREYFYGRITKNNPHTIIVSYDLVSIYKIEEDKDSKELATVVPVDISAKIKHSVLALSASANPEDLPTSNILGFVSVVDADDEKKEMTILSPLPGPIPDGLLVLTYFTFPET